MCIMVLLGPLCLSRVAICDVFRIGRNRETKGEGGMDPERNEE